ncbi:MAG: bifunctional metallophosphatase/5'-nucleotidase, partial [Tardiphaga sp.]
MKIVRFVLAASAILFAPAANAQSPAPVDLRILAMTDFHGYLRPPPGGITIADPADASKKITVPAGGAEHLATLVRELRDGHRNTVFVAAG